MAENPDRKALALYTPHIFNAKPQVLDLRGDEHLIDIVDSLDLTPAQIRSLKIKLGDHLIPWKNWHLLKPKLGVPLSLAVVPQGGDSLRLIATIAIVIAAAWVGDYVNAYATASAYGTTAYGAIAAGAFTLAGGFAINSQIPEREKSE